MDKKQYLIIQKNKIMNKHEFEIKMKSHKKNIDALMEEVRKDVIFFNDLNPETTTYDLPNTTQFVDGICEDGGWIIDKINNQLNSKKGLKYKIRKALGFTQP